MSLKSFCADLISPLGVQSMFVFGPAWSALSNCHRAGDYSVLQHHTHDQEHKVEQKHQQAQELAHPPLARRDGDDDEQQHEEQQHDGTEQSVTADLHRLEVVDDVVQEPGERQAHSDIKDV